MQESMEMPPEAQKTAEAEGPEKKFNREIKRMAIDENHDLVAFGDANYVLQAQDDNTEKLQHEEIELAIVDKTSGKTVLKLSDKLRAISPKAIIDGVANDLNTFYWQGGTQTINIPMDQLFSDPRRIFSVLHEIGHAEDDSYKTADQLKRSERDRKIFMFQDPDDLGARSKENILNEERNAWAHAITAARKIKKEHGIDLFQMFKNADEFMGWLRVKGLRNYEEQLEEPTTKNRAVKMFKKSEKRRNFRKTIEQYPELLQPILYALETNVRSDFIEKTF
jgi:hypothetical protein